MSIWSRDGRLDRSVPTIATSPKSTEKRLHGASCWADGAGEGWIESGKEAEANEQGGGSRLGVGGMDD